MIFQKIWNGNGSAIGVPLRPRRPHGFRQIRNTVRIIGKKRKALRKKEGMNPWRVFPEKEKCQTNGSMGVSSLTDRPLLRVLYRFGPRASSRPVPVTQADAVIRRGAGDDRVEVGVLPGPFQESLHAACLAGSVARRQDCPGAILSAQSLLKQSFRPSLSASRNTRSKGPLRVSASACSSPG